MEGAGVVELINYFQLFCTPLKTSFNYITPCESDSRISQPRALGRHTPSLVWYYVIHQVWRFVIHACVSYDCGALRVQIFCSDLDVGACIFQENVPIETSNILKHTQYATINITCREVRKKSTGDYKCDLFCLAWL